MPGLQGPLLRRLALKQGADPPYTGVLMGARRVCHLVVASPLIPARGLGRGLQGACKRPARLPSHLAVFSAHVAVRKEMVRTW